MSNYINQVSDSLKNHISELANNPCLFLRNPNVDFSRKWKIDFKTFIGIMMNSGGATMSKELLDFFDFNKNTPSVSAFTQQRSKVLPETFWERNQHGSIVNKLHLNAFYDVLNRIYTDVLVQTAADYNEFRACATMIDRSKLENVIKRNLSPPDVINLIEKHVLPVRPGRKDPRKVKPQASVSFLYRVA